MSIFEQSKKDMRQITEDLNGFGQEFTITNPNGGQTVDLKGFHTKHHIGYDEDGMMVNSKTASIAFSEKQLTEASYPVRNADEEVDILDHLIDSKDSSGVTKKYIIRQMFPDEYLGLIVCILYDYEEI